MKTCGQNSVILTTFDLALSQRLLCEGQFSFVSWLYDTLFLQLIYDTVRSGGSNAAGFENCLDYIPSEMFSGRYYSCRTVLYSYFLYLFFDVMHKPIFFVGKDHGVELMEAGLSYQERWVYLHDYLQSSDRPQMTGLCLFQIIHRLVKLLLKIFVEW
mgnify:CR=1 FL=1